MALPSPQASSTALVTGSSSGIGADIARELASRGHGLTLAARREHKLRSLADELAQTYGVRVEVIAADISVPSERAALPGKIDALGLVVDVVVNNAGFTTVGPIQRANRDGEMAVVHTNVEAVVDLCTLFVAGMVARGRGAILNTASTAAFQPIPGNAVYAASKAFVLSYGRALGVELKGTGVSVTTLCPGPVKTGFADGAGMTDEIAAESTPRFMWVSAPRVAKMGVEGLAAGRPVVIPGTPNRILATVSHLMPKSVVLPLLAKRHPAMKLSAGTGSR
jgi:short-subunit dehydrogenase